MTSRSGGKGKALVFLAIGGALVFAALSPPLLEGLAIALGVPGCGLEADGSVSCLPPYLLTVIGVAGAVCAAIGLFGLLRSRSGDSSSGMPTMVAGTTVEVDGRTVSGDPNAAALGPLLDQVLAAAQRDGHVTASTHVIDAREVPGLREAVTQLTQNLGQGGGAAMSAGYSPGAWGAASASDPVERLRVLTELRDRGALTEAEFEQVKDAIIRGDTGGR